MVNYIINSVGETRLSHYTPYRRRTTVSLKIGLFYSFDKQNPGQFWPDVGDVSEQERIKASLVTSLWFLNKFKKAKKKINPVRLKSP